MERNFKHTSVFTECKVNWDLDHKKMKVPDLI